MGGSIGLTLRRTSARTRCFHGREVGACAQVPLSSEEPALRLSLLDRRLLDARQPEEKRAGEEEADEDQARRRAGEGPSGRHRAGTGSSSAPGVLVRSRATAEERGQDPCSPASRTSADCGRRSSGCPRARLPAWVTPRPLRFQVETVFLAFAQIEAGGIVEPRLSRRQQLDVLEAGLFDEGLQRAAVVHPAVPPEAHEEAPDDRPVASGLRHVKAVDQLVGIAVLDVRPDVSLEVGHDESQDPAWVEDPVTLEEEELRLVASEMLEHVRAVDDGDGAVCEGKLLRPAAPDLHLLAPRPPRVPARA